MLRRELGRDAGAGLFSYVTRTRDLLVSAEGATAFPQAGQRAAPGGRRLSQKGQTGSAGGFGAGVSAGFFSVTSAFGRGALLTLTREGCTDFPQRGQNLAAARMGLPQLKQYLSGFAAGAE